MLWEVELILFLFLILLAVLALEANDLLVAVVILTIFSFTIALLFTAMGGIDVGFTEAVIGAGVTGIFFIIALFKTSIRTKD